jgi:glycosyltransferase involved in cell wall biosynthesis
MPVFNAERFLKAAITSIRQQTFENFEFIIVNDGSTDSSEKLVGHQMEQDKRIYLIKSAHQGVASARNTGIANARGKFIATMDADDISLPRRFALQVQELQKHPELVVVGGAYDLVDALGNIVCEKWPPVSPPALRNTLDQGGNPFCASTTMIQRDALQLVGGYRSGVDLAEDYDLWLRLRKKGEMCNLPEKILQYRVCPSSGTFSNTKIQFAGILRAWLHDRGLPINGAELDINELLYYLGGEEREQFLVDRASGYPITMVETGYFSDAIRLSKLFSTYTQNQHRASVLWEFMRRSVLTALSKHGRASALQLLIHFLSTTPLAGVLWQRRSELRAMLSLLTNNLSCSLISMPPTTTRASCGHVDSVVWMNQRRTIVISGWARFPEISRNPSFLIECPIQGRASVKRMVRPDVASAIGQAYLFTGFEIVLKLSVPAEQIASIPTYLSSKNGVFHLDNSGVAPVERN